MQPHILIIRLSSLGDLILTIPLLRALRERYVAARIDLLVKKEYADLAWLFGYVDEVISFDTEAEDIAEMRQELAENNYTYVLDLHSNLRSKVLRILPHTEIDIIHKRSFRRWLLVNFKINLLKSSPDVIGRYFETAKELGVKDEGNAPIIETTVMQEKKVALVPGAKHWNKRWLPEYFIAVASALIKEGYQIEIHGSAEEKALGDSIAKEFSAEQATNYCGTFSLEELPTRLASCELAITNDSGLMHLAAAVGVRTVSMFGPTVREFGFMPRGKNVTIIENTNLSCRPCTTIGSDHCPKGHFKCMKEITPEMVIEKIFVLPS